MFSGADTENFCGNWMQKAAHLYHRQELSLLERTKIIRQYGLQMLSHTQSAHIIFS